MLELLLNDGQEYQNYSKEFFLMNLTKFFDLFKAEGDTYLRAISGFCDNCNKGCSGFHFTGNNSNYFTTFVFDESEHDFTDIYYCSIFKP